MIAPAEHFATTTASPASVLHENSQIKTTNWYGKTVYDIYEDVAIRSMVSPSKGYNERKYCIM